MGNSGFAQYIDQEWAKGFDDARHHLVNTPTAECRILLEANM